MVADNLDQLLESSTYVHKGEIMPSPKAILKPVLEKLELLNADMKTIRVFANDESGTSSPEHTKSRDIAYSKAMVEAIFPYEYSNDHDLCVRVAYNLKRNKPQYMVFIGYRDRTNNNLVVWTHSQAKLFYDFVALPEAIEELCKQKWSRDFDQFVQNLTKTYLPAERLNEAIGFLLKEATLNRYGSSVVTQLVKNIQDRNGMHYVPAGDGCDLYKILRATGVYLGKSRNLAVPTKTLNFISTLILCGI